MKERFSAWGLPVCLVMVAYGVAGVWLARDSGLLAYSLPSMVPAVLVGLVGVVYLFGEMRRQPDEPRTNPLGSLLGIYASAWNRLWQTSWILKLFACIALVRVLGSVASSLPFLLANRGNFGQTGDEPWTDWYRLMSSSFDLAQSVSLREFLPTSGLAFSGLTLVVFTLGLLISLFWIDKRLAALAHSSEDQPGVPFARALLYPAAALFAVISVVGSVDMYRFYLLTHAAAAGSQRFHELLPPLLGRLLMMICYAIGNSVIIGGLIGGLRRMQREESVTTGGFFTDSVRYLKPMLGVYLVFGLPFQVLILVGRNYWAGALLPTLLPILMLLIFFAPFAVVDRGCGAWEAITSSASLWKRKPWQTASFVTIGWVLIALPMLPFVGARVLVGKWSLLSIPIDALTGAVGVMFHAFVILALWEFYTRTDEPESRE
jgi:hypothetical protein